jgi:hypothetical protein
MPTLESCTPQIDTHDDGNAPHHHTSTPSFSTTVGDDGLFWSLGNLSRHGFGTLAEAPQQYRSRAEHAHSRWPASQGHNEPGMDTATLVSAHRPCGRCAW